MQSHDAELYEALKAYTEAAVTELIANGLAIDPEAEGGWHARAENAFVLREPQDIRHELRQAITAQHMRPEYGATVDALRAHPVIGGRLGKSIGTAFMLARLDEDRLPDNLIDPFLRRGCFDADEFDTAFAQLVESLTSATTWTVIAPLSGVASDVTPIKLDDGVEIVEMSDAEVIACLSTSLLRGLGIAGSAFVTNRIAIRLTEHWPIVTADNYDGSSAGEAFSRRADLIEAVVHLLRLVKPGDISVPGTVAFSPSSFEGRVYHFGYSPAPRHSEFEQYLLGPADADELLALWRDFRGAGAQGNRFLVTAVRRFGFSGERPRPEDRIVDLMIAAEALFTPGTQTEVAHKVALHAAAFLAGHGASAAAIFETMKQGYTARSAVAHGGKPKIRRLANGEDGTLDRLVVLLSDHMRDALKRMIRRAVDGTTLADQAAWNEFILHRLDN